MLDAASPPQDFRALRELMLQRQPGLPKRLAQIAGYALRQPQEIAFRTVADVAAQAGVPPSALIRFAQALGYGGFSDLQAVFRAHARDRWPDYDTRLEALRDAGAAEGPAGLLQHFVDAGALSLERMRASLDPQALAAATALLAAADTICLVASRRAFPVTAYLAYALRRLAMRCELADQAGGLAPEQVALLTPRDALLSVSFTPYAAATIDLTAAAHRRGVPVVAITDSPFSPLTQLAAVWLEVAEADHLGFRSLSASLALATTLAVAVAQERQTKRNIHSDLTD